MAAPKGNRFWEARSSHGRDPIFKTPEDLWNASVEYFEWVENNPLYESKPFAYQGIVVQEPVAKMRAMTIMGLCNFLDISMDAWAQYRKREDFIGVVSRVEQIIRQQKFEGASADLLNPNIIARDLGLAEKQEHTGEGGGPLAITVLSGVPRAGD
jgi:DNA-packaging protein gp3